MNMTLEQFKKLNPDLLTRAIAEVVCGWEWCVTTEEYETDENGVQEIEIGQFWVDRKPNGYDFEPLLRIDDAVMCVSKLEDNDRIIVYQRKLMQILFQDVDEVVVGSKMMDWIINCSAKLRCLALWNTVPEIEARYNQLKGER